MTNPAPLMIQATFGELLRRWRRQNDLNQSALGALLEPRVCGSTVSSWETDVRLPSRRYLSQILALTGIPAAFALGLPHTPAS